VNLIESQIARSQFANAPHLVIAVDGIPLNVTIDAALPNRQFAGLVPTLLDWLSDPVERSLVWDRILPTQGNTAHAPLLMCPDDCDLWCSVIIADVVLDNRVVWWRRLGVDATREGLPTAVGTTVEWINGLGPYCFTLADYQKCINSFGPNDP
jgi:hypothetical protein